MAPASKTKQLQAARSPKDLQVLAQRVVREGMQSSAYKELSKAIATTPGQLKALNSIGGYSQTMSFTNSKLAAICGTGTAQVSKDLEQLERDLRKLVKDIRALTEKPKPRRRTAARTTATGRATSPGNTAAATSRKAAPKKTTPRKTAARKAAPGKAATAASRKRATTRRSR
ncbi:MAG: hypothetical protein QOE92_880 [Chloroflexota bacterium]|jgi:hypothetical protein|nr:hypothetical protein [Chloroflexota bacterium]